jgi:hypothetical protein
MGPGGLTRRISLNRAALPPYLVLLPMGFAEPGWSPSLLVSSYLAVSPLPRPAYRGTLAEAVYFLWHFPYPGRVKQPGRWALPTTEPFGVRTFLRGMPPDPTSEAGLPAVELEPKRPGDHHARHAPQSHHTDQTPDRQPTVRDWPRHKWRRDVSQFKRIAFSGSDSRPIAPPRRKSAEKHGEYRRKSGGK